MAVLYHGDFKVIIPAEEMVDPPEDLHGLPKSEVLFSMVNRRMGAEVDYVEALAARVKEAGSLPPINHDALTQSYPGAYQSLLQIIHNTGERLNHRMEVYHTETK